MSDDNEEFLYEGPTSFDFKEMAEAMQERMYPPSATVVDDPKEDFGINTADKVDGQKAMDILKGML